jgi:hypothetical protein
MIQLTGIYQFEEWNFLMEDPILHIDLSKVEANPVAKTITLVVSLETDSAPSKAKFFGLVVRDIPVDSFQFDVENNNDMQVLGGRVIARLNEINIYKPE